MPELPPLTDLLSKAARVPVCVAYSGGLDSTVLLHALATSSSTRDHGLRAWHVHHGLQPDADAWAAHCVAICEDLDVPLQVSRVAVRRDGEGVEASARRARHAVFADGLGDGEALALAHHRDDQAETFVLRALRASGPDGLAAMQAWRRFARGYLWRPWLDVPRVALEAYAAEHGLRWVEDPSNTDASLDRNFLRQRVLPLLRERWPHATAAMARSAALCNEASGLLDAEDSVALATVTARDPAWLSRSRLSELPTARRARVLRRWIDTLALPPLPANGITRIESTLLPVRADAAAAFQWRGATIHAWRDWLHAGWLCTPLPNAWQASWDGIAPLLLPGGGALSLRAVGAASAAIGIAAISIAAEAAPTPRRKSSCGTGTSDLASGFGRTLLVHARRGGERITLPGRGHSHALKQVLQDAGIPPWERAALPLLSTPDGELLAAGDGIVSAGFERWLNDHDARLHWGRVGAPGIDRG